MRENIANGMRALAEHMLDLLFAALIALVMFTMGMYTAQSEVVAAAALLQGSSINGIDVSRMDPNQAVEMVIAAEEERLLQKVALTLSAQGYEATYRAEQLGATTNARELISQAVGRVREGNLLKRTSAYFALRDGVQLDIQISYSAEKAERICREFAQRMAIEPVDASVKLSESGDSFDYVADRAGQTVDFSQLYRRVWEQLEGGVPSRIEVEALSVEASVPLQSLIDNTMRLSGCETEVAAADEALLRDMADKLNGYALHVGKSMSLRELLFPDGEVPTDQVAAASQVATTLYDALLLAGMDKVERHPNLRPPPYISPGLDAALDGKRDLVMRNGGGSAVYILAGVGEGVLKVEAHGRLMRLDETVQIRTSAVRTIEPEPPLFIDDPTLPAGKNVLKTQAQEGYKVSSYRETLVGGVITANELLSMDT